MVCLGYFIAAENEIINQSSTNQLTRVTEGWLGLSVAYRSCGQHADTLRFTQPVNGMWSWFFSNHQFD